MSLYHFFFFFFQYRKTDGRLSIPKNQESHCLSAQSALGPEGDCLFCCYGSSRKSHKVTSVPVAKIGGSVARRHCE